MLEIKMEMIGVLLLPPCELNPPKLLLFFPFDALCPAFFPSFCRSKIGKHSSLNNSAQVHDALSPCCPVFEALFIL